MPIHAQTNLYPGVNPHLNSFLQQPGGGWKIFHTAHVNHIFEAVQPLLPDAYYAFPEASLQIGVYGDDTETRRTTGTDVSIYRTGETGYALPEGVAVQTPTLTMPLQDDIPEADELTAAVIYRMEGGKFPGTPITRIELLSPANKRGGSHHMVYREKRRQTLKSGLRLIEVDYLHERPPLLPLIGDYSAGDDAAAPYHVTVSDPRPFMADRQVQVYAVGVLDALPVFAVPLDGEDVIALDLNSVYQHTFKTLAGFHAMIDYAQPPENFAAYTDADQAAIQAHMAHIANQHGTEPD